MLIEHEKDTSTAHHPLFIEKNDGSVEIPPTWVGFYSGLSFSATDDETGVHVTVWLDENGEVPLKAHCTAQDGLIDTISMFDICLGFIKDPESMVKKGVPAEKLSMAFGHMMMLMETGAKSCLPYLAIPDQPTRAKYKKAHSIYSRARVRLDELISQTAAPNISAAVRPQHQLAAIH